ncbi:phenylacetic acid degradation operon negative regulatory protein PaaX [Zobellella endophytica]|uniref:Phenylacetic acid degradation operon negative regulatory protein PaaX n=1 Tax=Zobellella endophytica TaxID=2116700 RepID=A0A2P7R621_9GAMM|nr:phenylacetic acid degradation operon negative regulatory protein PaaX [Zobellella endophytica]PSJ45666.1 phenylacetic acid degradation operon negative regulatory protein PaaX [Zobellella endophytica]
MDSRLSHFIQQALDYETVSGTSLIMTIFGDSLAHRGGGISLASLIELVAGFGFGERFVRTSVFRLAKHHWLSSERIGRLSFYRVTDSSVHRFRQAEARIYGIGQRDWDGQWDLVLLSSVELEAKAQLRKELEWLGCAGIAPNLMAYPGLDQGKLRQLLLDLDMAEQVVVFRARTPDLSLGVAPPLPRMVSVNWPLEDISQRYHEFLTLYRPLLPLLEDGAGLDPAQAFQLRTLLIYHYRRVLLKDPNLPIGLLPANWPGAAAQTLCANIYNLLYRAADEHLWATGRTAEGPLPPAGPAFYRRFGGLRQ